MIGIAAGLVGTTVAAPVDMVRTRLMSGAGAEGVGSAVLRIWAEDGPRGFLRGWWPAYLRSARSPHLRSSADQAEHSPLTSATATTTVN